jgi:hypothetical protein
MAAAKRPIPWLLTVVMLPLGMTACGDGEDGDAVDACRHVEAITQPQTVAAGSATPDEVRSWAIA